VDLASVNNHLLESLSRHLDAIRRQITALEISTKATGEQNFESRITNCERLIKSIEERSQQLQQQSAVSRANSEVGTLGGGAAIAGEASARTGDDLSWGDKLYVVEGVLTVLSREVEKVTVKVGC